MERIVSSYDGFGSQVTPVSACDGLPDELVLAKEPPSLAHAELGTVRIERANEGHNRRLIFMARFEHSNKRKSDVHVANLENHQFGTNADLVPVSTRVQQRPVSPERSHVH